MIRDTKANSRARQYKSCKKIFITRLKSYPYPGPGILSHEKRDCIIIEHTEMSHPNTKQTATWGIRTTVAEQKQQAVKYTERITHLIMT